MLNEEELATLQLQRDLLYCNLAEHLSSNEKFGYAKALKIADATADTYHKELLAAFTELDDSGALDEEGALPSDDWVCKPATKLEITQLWFKKLQGCDLETQHTGGGWICFNFSLAGSPSIYPHGDTGRGHYYFKTWPELKTAIEQWAQKQAKQHA